MMEIQLKVQKPLKDLVYLELKHKILTGEIVSQTRLMEIDLSEKMNVSRTPIREAIKRLADDGLVKVEPRRGAYVANISIKDMLDVFEVREDMEGFAAKLAAERITDEEKAELRYRVQPLILIPYSVSPMAFIFLPSSKTNSLRALT